MAALQDHDGSGELLSTVVSSFHTVYYLHGTGVRQPYESWGIMDCGLLHCLSLCMILCFTTLVPDSYTHTGAYQDTRGPVLDRPHLYELPL